MHQIENKSLAHETQMFHVASSTSRSQLACSRGARCQERLWSRGGVPCGCPQARDSPWLTLWGWVCILLGQVHAPVPPPAPAPAHTTTDCEFSGPMSPEVGEKGPLISSSSQPSPHPWTQSWHPTPRHPPGPWPPGRRRGPWAVARSSEPEAAGSAVSH